MGRAPDKVRWSGAHPTSGGGVLVGGLLVDTIGITSTFLIFGFASLSGIILLANTPRRHEVAATVTTGSKRAEPMIGLWGCALALAVIEQMVANLTGRIVADRIGSLLPLSIGITSLTGLLLGFRSFGALILGPLTGIVGDRFGRRRLLMILIALQGCCIAGIAFFRPWILVVLSILLQFTAGNAVHLLLYTLAGDAATHQDGAIHVSRFSTFLDLGTAAGPIIGFALYAGFGFLWVAALSWLLIAGAWVSLRWFVDPATGR